jgi:hypothetical protein
MMLKSFDKIGDPSGMDPKLKVIIYKTYAAMKKIRERMPAPGIRSCIDIFKKNLDV